MSKKHHQKIAKIFKKGLTSVAKWCIIILEWESIIIFFIFLPRLHASSSSSSSSSHETPGGVEAPQGDGLEVNHLSLGERMFAKNFFKKYLKTTCFYVIIMLEVEKGVLYMKRLGALSFHYILYTAKNFLEKLFKRGCNFLFVLI